MNQQIFEDGYYVFSWPNGSGSSIVNPRINGKWNVPFLRIGKDGTQDWISDLECDLGPSDWESGYEYRPATKDEINHYKICKEFDRYVGEGYYEIRYSGENGSISGSYYVKMNDCGKVLFKKVFIGRSNDYGNSIREMIGSITDWRSSDRELIPMSEDRIKWFNKCLKEDNVLNFPLMSESERQVAEGEIVLGNIYWNDDVRSWCLPEETSHNSNFGGPFLYAGGSFYKNAGHRGSFRLGKKDVTEIVEGHEDYSWIRYCFDNETNTSKEEWEKLVSTKVEVGKVYEVTYKCGTGTVVVLVNQKTDKYFHGDYFNPDYPDIPLDHGTWSYEETTVELVEDQEYWLANFENKEIKYKYANVVYDLESMVYDPLQNGLSSMFVWDSTPQGGSYWSEIHCEGNTEESEYYLAEMKAQYEKSEPQDQTPQETRDWLGESLTIDQLRGKLFDINEQSSRYWGIVCDKESEIRILKQEIDDLNNKLSQNKIMKLIRKIV